MMAGGERYARPVTVVSALHDFAAAALDRGAERVWSIGEIVFGGNTPDDQWIRYEASVAGLFGHLPLQAVCLYDVASLSAPILEGACETHRYIDQGTGRRVNPTPSGPADVWSRPWPAPRIGQPDLVLRPVRSVPSTRLAVRSFLAGVLPGRPARPTSSSSPLSWSRMLSATAARRWSSACGRSRRGSWSRSPTAGSARSTRSPACASPTTSPAVWASGSAPRSPTSWSPGRPSRGGWPSRLRLLLTDGTGGAISATGPVTPRGPFGSKVAVRPALVTVGPAVPLDVLDAARALDGEPGGGELSDGSRIKSPAVRRASGWGQRERASVDQRGPDDDPDPSGCSARKDPDREYLDVCGTKFTAAQVNDRARHRQGLPGSVSSPVTGSRR